MAASDPEKFFEDLPEAAPSRRRLDLMMILLAGGLIALVVLIAMSF